jgi:hypothetical protein
MVDTMKKISNKKEMSAVAEVFTSPLLPSFFFFFMTIPGSPSLGLAT